MFCLIYPTVAILLDPGVKSGRLKILPNKSFSSLSRVFKIYQKTCSDKV